MIIKTLSKSIREYKKQSLLTPFFVSCVVVLECLIPLVMAKLVDNMSSTSIQPILIYSITLVILAGLSLTSGIIAGRTAATASCGFAKNLRKDLYYKVQDFGFSEIDKFSSASLVTRLTTDVSNVQHAFQMIIRIAVRTPLMLIFSMVMSFTINWKIALIFLAILPILGVALFVIIFKAMPLFNKVFKKYDNLNSSIEENVQGIRVVKSYVREDYEQEKFDKSATEVRNNFVKAEKLVALNNPIMSFCIHSAIVLVCLIGSRLIVSSGATELTTGQLSSLLNYGIQILSSMMMLSMIFVMLSISAESAKRVSEVLNEKPELVSPEDGITKVKNGNVEFKNVSFKYQEKAENFALKNINLTIDSGQTLGILGGTGSSKTTLIQLISRLYDTTQGEVKVGGINVKDYDLTSLRNSVAVVLQKNVLFSGTIKENLRWGNKDATDEEIVRVCKLAQADDFIQGFPDKYDTILDQGGTNVSGGQKQRLCIARALLKKPKILILDDSTSAVDTKTDALIRNAFEKEIPNTTKIIIAQRVSSIESADKIIVLDGGEIVEQGNHLELLKKNGIYADIYKTQTKLSGGKNNETK